MAPGREKTNGNVVVAGIGHQSIHVKEVGKFPGRDRRGDALVLDDHETPIVGVKVGGVVVAVHKKKVIGQSGSPWTVARRSNGGTISLR